MTSIEKLLIQGVRSFSPQNRAIIEFFKPLTLIVGHNGAGKTTIIECLKYACTGDMPPDSKKGQAFLHDPKLAGEREIKAQIKLRFQSVTGKPIVATRCLQLTQKANKQECKSIDSSLQTIDAKGNVSTKATTSSDLTHFSCY
jgi:DNA repair protein RAD50